MNSESEEIFSREILILTRSNVKDISESNYRVRVGAVYSSLYSLYHSSITNLLDRAVST